MVLSISKISFDKAYKSLRFCSEKISLSVSTSNTSVAVLDTSCTHFSSISSKPFRASSSGLNARHEVKPHSACKKGEPATNNTIIEGMRTTNGLFITRLAIQDQNPSSPDLSLKEKGTLSELTRSPSIESKAGKSTIDDVRATKVAQIPPQPKEGRLVFWKTSIPDNPAITVNPENRIARPAVALVIAIAVR